MSTAVGLVAGALVAAVLWRALRVTFEAPVFARQNYRGATLPVAAGLIIPLTAVALAAVERGLVALGATSDLLRVGDLTLLAAVGFGLLGLIDDLAGTNDEKGFRGHLAAMAHGRLTTGGLKLVGGGLLAVVVTAPHDLDRPGWLVVDTLLVALAANLGNLFDRAPGRTIKVALILGLVLLGTQVASPPLGVAVVVGAALGLLVPDLREELMLGDTGANVLGAVLGLGVVLSCGEWVRLGVLVVVLVLNLASERVSFSKVIDKVAPLRALDRAGRLPPE